MEKAKKDFVDFLSSIPIIDRFSTWEATLKWLKRDGGDERVDLLAPYEDSKERELSRVCFANHIKHLEEEHLREKRKQLENERELLRKHIHGLFDFKSINEQTRWRKFIEDYEDDATVKRVLKQPQGLDVVRDIWDEIVDARRSSSGAAAKAARSRQKSLDESDEEGEISE